MNVRFQRKYVMMFPKLENGVKKCVSITFAQRLYILVVVHVDPKLALNFFTDFCCFLHIMQLSPVFNVNELSNVPHKQRTTRCYGACCESQGDLRYRPLTIF